MQQTPAIIVDGIYKEYRMDHIRVPVLNGVSFEVPAGEIAVVVGPSGVGKSTLLNIIGTLDHPTSGRILINGSDITAAPDQTLTQFRNREIGFIFQFHHLLPEFTALENVMMPRLIQGASHREAEQKARDLLAHVGLSERLIHFPNELSGGEQQRVAVARALINTPAVVLADEPTGNLDRENSEAIHALLWNLAREFQQTFIIVTHNEHLAAQADRIIHLLDGRVASVKKNTNRPE